MFLLEKRTEDGASGYTINGLFRALNVRTHLNCLLKLDFNEQFKGVVTPPP